MIAQNTFQLVAFCDKFTLFMLRAVVCVPIEKVNFTLCNCFNALKSHIFFIQIHFGTVFFHHCVCLHMCVKDICWKIIMLQIYNKVVVKTNQENKLMAIMMT